MSERGLGKRKRHPAPLKRIVQKSVAEFVRRIGIQECNPGSTLDLLPIACLWSFQGRPMHNQSLFPVDCQYAGVCDVVDKRCAPNLAALDNQLFEPLEICFREFIWGVCEWYPTSCAMWRMRLMTPCVS